MSDESVPEIPAPRLSRDDLRQLRESLARGQAGWNWLYEQIINAKRQGELKSGPAFSAVVTDVCDSFVFLRRKLGARRIPGPPEFVVAGTIYDRPKKYTPPNVDKLPRINGKPVALSYRLPCDHNLEMTVKDWAPSGKQLPPSQFDKVVKLYRTLRNAEFDAINTWLGNAAAKRRSKWGHAVEWILGYLKEHPDSSRNEAREAYGNGHRNRAKYPLPTKEQLDNAIAHSRRKSKSV